MTKSTIGALSYERYYRLGLAFWDTYETDRGLAELVAGEAALSPGRVLDIGCGTGRYSVYLARLGWQVTGIDFVHRAIAQARDRAAAHRVAVRLVHGDIGDLPHLVADDDFDLFVDFGCLHGIPVESRDGYAAAVTKTAAPDATLWIWGRLRQGVAGVSAEELIERFPDWDLVAAEEVGQEEMRIVPREIPPVQRRLRDFMTSPRVPPAWRFRLTRRAG